MRKILKTLLFVGIVTLSGTAQVAEVTESNVSYEDKLREAAKISVDIPKDDLKDGFNDFVKDHFEADLKGYGFLARKDVVYTEFEEMPLLADQAVKLIGSFQERGGEMDLYLFAQWEDNSFITKKDDARTHERLFETARDFLEYYVPSYYAERLEEANDVFEDAARDVEKMKDDLKKSKSDLQDLRQEMVEKEKEIADNERELKKLERTLEEKEDQLEEVRKKHNKSEKRLKAVIGKS